MVNSAPPLLEVCWFRPQPCLKCADSGSKPTWSVLILAPNLLEVCWSRLQPCLKCADSGSHPTRRANSLSVEVWIDIKVVWIRVKEHESPTNAVLFDKYCSFNVSFISIYNCLKLILIDYIRSKAIDFNWLLISFLQKLGRHIPIKFNYNRLDKSMIIQYCDTFSGAGCSHALMKTKFVHGEKETVQFKHYGTLNYKPYRDKIKVRKQDT